MGSVFVTIAITIERYVVVCHPTSEFKGRRLLILLPIISAILYNIPKFFEIEATEYANSESVKVGEQIISVNKSYSDRDEMENIKVEDVGYHATPLRLNYWYVIFYVTWSKLLLVEIIPWATVVILNIQIARKMYTYRLERQNNFQKVEG